MGEVITTEAITERRKQLMTGPCSTWLTLPDDPNDWHSLLDVIVCYPECVRYPVLLRGHHLHKALVEYSESLKAKHKHNPLHVVSVGQVGNLTKPNAQERTAA